jgi:hypothetical protein
MTEAQPLATDPRVQAALVELRRLISDRYPAATFDIFRGEDPDGVYLRATVDVDDTDEVIDVFIDRLVDLQVDGGLPVYVVMAVPPERVARHLQAHKIQRRALSAG